MTDNQLKEEIINYYDSCEKNYQHWWDLDRSLAMHAGFWDESTQTLTDALANENKVLADLADIQPGEKVLDAGCGYGGSAFFLAEHRGAKVVGITLCEQQVRKAESIAKMKNYTHTPEFYLMDYTQTTFADQSFDVVWAIESVCHAANKKDFIKEAWRLLKPNGRMIIADGFHVKNEYTESEKILLAKAVNGWAVASMASRPNLKRL